MYTRFYKRTLAYHQKLKKGKSLIGSPWLYDADLFISEMGLRANQKWLLNRRDHNKVHNVVNSYWDKRLEVRTCYEKAGKWDAFIYLEFDSMADEATAKHKTIRLGSALPKAEAVQLYNAAKELKDEGEWNDWTNEDWKLAIMKRIDASPHSHSEDQTVRKWKQSTTLLSYEDWVIATTPTRNGESLIWN